MGADGDEFVHTQLATESHALVTRITALDSDDIATDIFVGNVRAAADYIWLVHDDGS